MHSYVLIERRHIWIMFTPSEKDFEQPENEPEAKLIVIVTGDLNLLERLMIYLFRTKIDDSMPQ